MKYGILIKSKNTKVLSRIIKAVRNSVFTDTLIEKAGKQKKHVRVRAGKPYSAGQGTGKVDAEAKLKNELDWLQDDLDKIESDIEQDDDNGKYDGSYGDLQEQLDKIDKVSAGVRKLTLPPALKKRAKILLSECRRVADRVDERQSELGE